MNENKLKDFYSDKAMQESWVAFVMNTLEQEAMMRIWRGEDVSGIKLAREILEKCFQKLDEKFETKKPRKPRSGV